MMEIEYLLTATPSARKSLDLEATLAMCSTNHSVDDMTRALGCSRRHEVGDQLPTDHQPAPRLPYAGNPLL